MGKSNGPTRPNVIPDLASQAKERNLRVGFSTFSLEGLERVQCSDADFLKIGFGNENLRNWSLRPNPFRHATLTLIRKVEE